MKAHEKNLELGRRIARLLDPSGDKVSAFELSTTAATLRRAEMTLHRWAEEECNGTIQCEDKLAAEGPRLCFRHFEVRHEGTGGKWIPAEPVRIPDREAGALRRVAKVCRETGLHFFHQTDPRGCALYVAAEPLTASNYSQRGIACCVN